MCLSKDAIETLMEKRQRLWKYVENVSFMTLNKKGGSVWLANVTGDDKLN
ncbi:MAG: hypothetical protein ACR5LA_06090 [Wolbachia sp.]